MNSSYKRPELTAIRKPEKMLLGQRVKASYHPVVLPAHQGNPLIEALPPRRTPREVCLLVRGKIPSYDQSARQLEATARKDHLETLSRVFVTLPRHMRVEEAVMEAIRNSYSFRNPLKPGYMLEAIEQVEAVDYESQDCDEPMVGASCMVGAAGTGKTRILKRCLVRGCPQIIEHYEYQGKKLGVRQIAWIYVSCAHDGSVKSLCEDIAEVMDVILGGTDYLSRVRRAETERGKKTELLRLLALHAVGLIVIDEFQNICVGRCIERTRLARFLCGMMEGTSTRIMLVGTPEAETEVVKDMALMRRTVGENGQIAWGAIIDTEEWIRFLKGIWRYQYTRTPTLLTSETKSLAEKLHQLSYGIPDLAVKLYRMAQYEVIGKVKSIDGPDGEIKCPDETITCDLLTFVATTRMQFAQNLLRGKYGDPRFTYDWDKPEVQLLLRGNERDPESELTPVGN